MAGLKPIEIILILAVILLLFGAKRLPDAARGLGRSLRIFKSEIKAAQDEDGESPPKQIQATSDEVVDRTTETAPDAGSADR
jgi:sec-independent protein translocase protein TatA